MNGGASLLFRQGLQEIMMIAMFHNLGFLGWKIAFFVRQERCRIVLCTFTPLTSVLEYILSILESRGESIILSNFDFIKVDNNIIG
jgi:hypothetical protein